MANFEFALKKLKTSSGKSVFYYSLAELENNGYGNFSSMPKSVKILLESLVRMQSHPAYNEEQVRSLSKWSFKYGY